MFIRTRPPLSSSNRRLLPFSIHRSYSTPSSPSSSSSPPPIIYHHFRHPIRYTSGLKLQQKIVEAKLHAKQVLDDLNARDILARAQEEEGNHRHHHGHGHGGGHSSQVTKKTGRGGVEAKPIIIPEEIEELRSIASTDVLLLLEHHPVYTLGRRTFNNTSSVSPSEEESEEMKRLVGLGADYIQTKRGGEITYHGPGQLVGYPILDLNRGVWMGTGKASVNGELSTRCYVSQLLHLLHSLLTSPPLSLSIPHPSPSTISRGASNSNPTTEAGSSSSPPQQPSQPSPTPHPPVGLFPTHHTKISSVGIQLQKRITSHGFSLNLTDEPLKWFKEIVACGLEGVRATSLESELRKLGRLMIEVERHGGGDENRRGDGGKKVELPNIQTLVRMFLPYFSESMGRELIPLKPPSSSSSTTTATTTKGLSEKGISTTRWLEEMIEEVEAENRIGKVDSKKRKNEVVVE